MKLTKTILTLLGCAAFAGLFTGCASVLCGPHQKFVIETKPGGADVVIYNPRGETVFQNKTPCTASLARTAPEEGRANYVVFLKKQGYSPVQIPLKSAVNKAYLANILFGGVGLIIDPLTGSQWTLGAEGADSGELQSAMTFAQRDDGIYLSLKEEQTPNSLAAH